MGGDRADRHVQEPGRAVRVPEAGGDLALPRGGIEREVDHALLEGVEYLVDRRDHRRAVLHGVLLAHQEQRDRRVTRSLPVGGQHGLRGGEVRGFVREVRRADDGGVDLAGLERAHRQLERVEA